MAHVEVIKIKGVGSMEHSERVSHIASDKKEKKRFRLKMPGAFTILFILTIIAVLATWIVPAGAYSKLSYMQERMNLRLSMHIIKQRQSQGHKINLIN